MTALDIIIDMHHDGFLATEIRTKLVEIFKTKAPAYSTITENIRKLSFNQDVNVNDKLMHRPVDHYQLDKISWAIEHSPNSSVRQLAQETNVPSTSVYRYLTQKLGYVHRSLRWIPHTLSQSNKIQRVELSKQLLELLRTAKKNNYRFFVTGDESWFSYTFSNNSQWVKKGMQPGTRVRRSFATPKVMITIFWSVDGIRVIDCLESGQTINSDYFTEHIMKPIAESPQFAKAKKQKQKFVAHMDNAPIHKSAKTQGYLADVKMVTAPHPAYSPDLAPSDFFLFGRLKNHPGSQSFDSPDDIVAWIEEKFGDLKEGELKSVFDHWEERLEWVIANKGEYYPK
jgi:histone-lysine N-methyltransferase SETMAR